MRAKYMLNSRLTGRRVPAPAQAWPALLGAARCGLRASLGAMPGARFTWPLGVTRITQRKPVGDHVLTPGNRKSRWLPAPESAPWRLAVTGMTVNEAVCEALFASPLQPSHVLTAETVADAIGSTVLRLGPAGCASHTAQELPSSLS